ncbi:MAG: hypothetical protein ACUVWO_17390 [Thermodesulfobacteriota bacterium]
MQYYVMKTGMEMFDACRAYGLGLILDALRSSEHVVKIMDCWLYYQIDGGEVDIRNNERLEALLTPDLPWSRVFLTTRGAARDRNVTKAKDVLTRQLEKILSDHRDFNLANPFDSGGETLSQSQDLAATKGYRVPVRTKASYTEGSNVEVLATEWTLSIIGELHFGVWRGGEALVCIIPKPGAGGIRVRRWRDIKGGIAKERVNRISTLTTLAHAAVLLTQEIRSRRTDDDPFVDRFSSLIFSAMTKTGNQWKPHSGGVFPLDFLYELLDRDWETSGETFRMFDHVLRIGNRKGREDISLSLSEFISHPTLDSWERYQRVHLRYLLNQGIKRAYPNECIKEVVENVRS